MRHVYLIAGVLAVAGAAAFAAPPQQGQQGQGTGAGGGRITRGASTALPLDRWQPKQLPALPNGMTIATIVAGDSVFHGAGACNTCHGPDAMGMPDKGSALSMGLNFIPKTWPAIDSLVTAGIPEAITRSSIAMPPRGAGSNLTADQIKQVAAYVWAISNTYDEPWPGGHRTHAAAAESSTGGKP